jgi:hypothetical protein
MAVGGVTPESVAAVDRSLTAKHEYHVVPNSWHGDFILCLPAPAKVKQSSGSALPKICTDPPGFDRAAFHKQFNAEVLAFFRTHLQAAPRHDNPDRTADPGGGMRYVILRLIAFRPQPQVCSCALAT